MISDRGDRRRSQSSCVQGSFEAVKATTKIINRTSYLPHPLATSPNPLTTAVEAVGGRRSRDKGKRTAMAAEFGGRYFENQLVEKGGGAPAVTLSMRICCNSVNQCMYKGGGGGGGTSKQFLASGMESLRSDAIEGHSMAGNSGSHTASHRAQRLVLPDVIHLGLGRWVQTDVSPLGSDGG